MESRKPEVSVVVPCYRGKNFLAEAIESVLIQTFNNFEILLVDNNADAETKAVMEKFCKENSEKIRIVHEPEQGVCSARNRGIIESRAEYIALLDDDDRMKPERLERQLDTARKSPDASMVVCGIDFLDESENVIEANVIGQRGSWKVIEDSLRGLFEGLHGNRNLKSFVLPLPSSMLISRKKSIEAGLFDIRLNPNFGEDLEFGVRMFLAGDFVLLKESLALYRKDSSESLSQRRSSSKVKFLYTQGNKLHFVLWELFANKNIDFRPAFRKMAAFHLKLAGRHFLRYRNGTDAARHLLFRAWRNTPTDAGAFTDFIKSLFPSSLHPRFFWFDNHRSDLLPEDTGRTFADKLFRIPPVWIDNRDPA
ncbi:MAG: glycosyltransferase family 2 protein [Nitrospirota bacterium]|nr:glycosyltransferase family 2 protein [Nitrospirota bacterium]